MNDVHEKPRLDRPEPASDRGDLDRGGAGIQHLADRIARYSRYAAAEEYGFLGYCGGEDHIEVRPWSILFVDRGLSSSGITRDNTTKFVVSVKDRKGALPLCS